MRSFPEPNMLHGDCGEKHGIIFDLQHYAIYDGPGIRTCIFFKGCPLHCWWCHNPESQSPAAEFAYNHHKCTGCRECIRQCPHNALTATKTGVIRNHTICRNCGICAAACPAGAIDRIGTVVTFNEIAESVFEDIPFFEGSNGGVTISGGEPTAQIDFLLEILGRFKTRGIHTALETCGFFPEAILPGLAAVTDLFLFDVKHTDERIHADATGVPPGRILDNFRKIVADCGSVRVIPRIPLIPGFNTDSDSVTAIALYLQSTGYSGTVHLMPYNGTAKHKYERLGKNDRYIDKTTADEYQLESIGDILSNYGFTVYCNY